MSSIPLPSGIDSPPLTKAERKRQKRKDKKEKKKQERLEESSRPTASNQNKAPQTDQTSSKSQSHEIRGRPNRNEQRHKIQHQNRALRSSRKESGNESVSNGKNDHQSWSDMGSPHERKLNLKFEKLYPSGQQTSGKQQQRSNGQQAQYNNYSKPQGNAETNGKHSTRGVEDETRASSRSLFSNLLGKMEQVTKRSKSPDRLFDDAMESFDHYNLDIDRVDAPKKGHSNTAARYIPIDEQRELIADYNRIRHRLDSYTKQQDVSAPGSDSEEEEHSDELHMLLSASKGRYYALNHEEYEKCFNCQEYGHISKGCPNQSVIRCFFCLGNHKKETCEINSCFSCSQGGHRSTNCPFRSLPSCRRCFRKGHKERECRMLINFREVSQRTPEHLNGPSSQLLCMNCGKSGHLQCYLKGNDVPAQIQKDGLYQKENLTVNAIQLDIPAGVVEDDMRDSPSGVILSASQRRKRLNELVPEEAEEMTLEQFKKYKEQEDEYHDSVLQEALGKRKGGNSRGNHYRPQSKPKRDWVPKYQAKRPKKNGRSRN